MSEGGKTTEASAESKVASGLPRAWTGDIAAYVALALLAGPVTEYAQGWLDSAMLGRIHSESALVSACAGVLLLGIGGTRRVKALEAREWVALLALIAPLWLAYVLSAVPDFADGRFDPAPWAVVFLFSIAAPLWLGLLSALQLVRDELPWAVAGGAIAGVGAMMLVLPIDAYQPTVREAPLVLLRLGAAIFTVFTWSYARTRLAAESAPIAAGIYLLLSALPEAAIAYHRERGGWLPIDWSQTAAPLALAAVTGAAIWWLWFRLLRRMTLAAFATRPLAIWVASALPFLFAGSYLSWRIDAALAIAVAAIAIALRARVAEEQPLALGLGDS